MAAEEEEEPQYTCASVPTVAGNTRDLVACRKCALIKNMHLVRLSRPFLSPMLVVPCLHSCAPSGDRCCHRRCRATALCDVPGQMCVRSLIVTTERLCYVCICWSADKCTECMLMLSSAPYLGIGVQLHMMQPVAKNDALAAMLYMSSQCAAAVCCSACLYCNLITLQGACSSKRRAATTVTQACRSKMMNWARH